MNGRIYDPRLGRFLQADPMVQAPRNAQNLNRYSYVLNNPLSYTDPSGYFFSSLWKKWLRPLASIAITAWMPVLLPYTGALAAATTGFAAGLVATGSLKGALVGAFTGALFHGIGSQFEQFKGSGNWGELGLSGGKFAAKSFAHGIAGGIQSSLNGGKFGHGFFSAGVTQAFSGRIGKFDADNAGFSPQRVFAAATVGGTTSMLTGGKFANGAVTGAFSRALNGESHRLFEDDPIEFDQLENSLSSEFSFTRSTTGSGLALDEQGNAIPVVAERAMGFGIFKVGVGYNSEGIDTTVDAGYFFGSSKQGLGPSGGIGVRAYGAGAGSLVANVGFCAQYCISSESQFSVSAFSRNVGRSANNLGTATRVRLYSSPTGGTVGRVWLQDILVGRSDRN